MTVAVVAGALVGLGCLGVVRGLRVAPPSLHVVAATVNRPVDAARPADGPGGISARAGRAAVGWIENSAAVDHPRWTALGPCFAITGESPEGLASKMLILGGAGLVVPPTLWLVAAMAGLDVPVEVPVMVAVAGVAAGVVLPPVELFHRARERQRHFRAVIGSFVDLVVLSLAGGVGIEGALLAASRVSADWAAKRMAKTLVKSRESGQSPWVALGQLGEEIGVLELVELSATVQLAGTEGARIRQSLSARAASLRRHEQAEAESAANAMTERLFLPGALLLVGFLLFVGFPAFDRILGGF